VPKTFNEKLHKKLYLKWVGMIEKVKDHVDPLAIEDSVRPIEETEADNEPIEIPDVLLSIDD